MKILCAQGSYSMCPRQLFYVPKAAILCAQGSYLNVPKAASKLVLNSVSMLRRSFALINVSIPRTPLLGAGGQHCKPNKICIYTCAVMIWRLKCVGATNCSYSFWLQNKQERGACENMCRYSLRRSAYHKAATPKTKCGDVIGQY